jgi:hypothetical protein
MTVERGTVPRCSTNICIHSRAREAGLRGPNPERPWFTKA